MTAPIIPADQWPDEFKGDNAKLIGCINALLSMDAAGALVPHGIGDHARCLLAAAAHRLAPAPATDLELVREAVEVAIAHAGPNDGSLTGWQCLLALIDGQASPHPEGTPMMPAGRFYDGCWKLTPEGVRHHARMLTQSWRAADSSELKRALEAGVLALIDGQAECLTCSGHGLIGSAAAGCGTGHGEACPDCSGRPTKGEGE